MRPKCYACGRKRAKALNLPGSYGQIQLYCSLRCAAKDAIERGLTAAVVWSENKQRWIDDGEQANGEDDDSIDESQN
jgi:hypothetical protein